MKTFLTACLLLSALAPASAQSLTQQHKGATLQELYPNYFQPQRLQPAASTEAHPSARRPLVLQPTWMTADAEATATKTKLIGCAIGGTCIKKSADYQFYSLTADADPDVTVYSNVAGGMLPNGGGIFSADGSVFDCVRFMSTAGMTLIYWYQYDATTWETLAGRRLADQQILAYDLTRDPLTGTAYGIFLAEDGRQLGTPDYPTGTRTTIGQTLSHPLLNIAASSDGQLYGVGTDGGFYAIDKATAQLTLIGQTGLTLMDTQQSATIDPTTDTFYWVAVKADQTTGLYAVDLTTGQAREVSPLDPSMQLMGLSIRPAEVEAKAPARIDDLKVTFEGSSLTGQVSFTAPAVAFDGSPLEGTVTCHVVSNGSLVTSLEGITPGQAVTEPVTFTAGSNAIQVYAQNEAGDGPRCKSLELWVGPDVPTPVTQLVATATDDTHLQLTWKAPSGSAHGGWLDPEAITYDVRRLPDSTLVATGITAATLTDEVHPAHLTPYRYQVTPKAPAGPGETVTSNYVKLGAPFDTPYYNSVATEDEFALFDVLDLNADGKTWTYEKYEARYLFSSRKTADDMLVAPAVNLKSDRLYNFSFKVRTMGDPEVMAIVYDKLGVDPKDFQHVLLADTTFTNQTVDSVCYKVHVAEDAAYRFAFHAKSTPAGWMLNVRKLHIDEGPMLTAPDSVTHLTAVAAPRGQLQATLTFDAPTHNVSGQPLTSLSEIRVYNEGRLAGSVKEPEVGARGLQVVDTQAHNGYNTYQVVALDAEGNAGFDTQVTVYVGVDVPTAPLNVKATEGTNGRITITWEAPSEGLNGGYVDPAGLTYTIQRRMAGTTTTLDSYLDLAPYTDKVAMIGDQLLFYYMVTATNAAGTSEARNSNSLISGSPSGYPYRESFSGEGLENGYISANHSDALVWTVRSVDGDNGSISLEHTSYDYMYFDLGKVALGKAVSPGLVYSLWSLQADARLQVMVIDNEANTTTVDTYDYAQVPAGEEGWVTRVVDLSQFKGMRNIRLRFLVYNDKQSSFVIDNVNLCDVFDHNLSLEAVAAGRRVVAGQPTTLLARVLNKGLQPVSNAAIHVTAGGELLTTFTLPPLESGQAQEVSIPVTLQANHQGTVSLQAEIVSDADLCPADNVAATDVQLTVLDYPTVPQLSATGNGSLALLSWQAPDLSGFSPVTTDDVEDYTSWLADGFGQWTVYDADGAPTVGIEGSQIGFPNMGTDLAAIVFEPYILFKRNPANPLTHSGEKCFAFFDAVPEQATVTDGYSDDYLISPRLSGRAQTVRLWARGTDGCTEHFELRYSTAGRLHTDFRAVAGEADVTSGWAEYAFELPDGAQYFAIRNHSRGQFVLLVDDVQYEPYVTASDLAIQGYNIYRDGIRVGHVGPEALSCVVRDCTSADVELAVSVCYTACESPLATTTAQPSAFQKKVVVEELTGTTCPNCPRGLAGMEWMRSAYPDEFIGLAVHNYQTDDPMYYRNYQPTGVFDACPGAPSCRLDRGPFMDPLHGTHGVGPGILPDFEAALSQVAPVGVEVSGTFDASHTLVDATVTVTSGKLDGDHQVVFVLVADSVKGQGPSWLQANTYAKRDPAQYADDPLLLPYCQGGQYGQSYAEVTYNDVVIGSSYDGTGLNQLPSLTLTSGQAATASFTLLMPTKTVLRNAFRPSHVSVVAFVIGADGRILNADKQAVKAAAEEGIDAIVSDQELTTRAYTLSGQLAPEGYRGFTIRQGACRLTVGE